MRYLHTMIRVKDLDAAMDFFCNKLGMVETKRMESADWACTLVYLAASGDESQGKECEAPLLELTYNWPDENGKAEEYDGGRNFGHLAYEVENIYETCQSLMDNGVTINRPPRDGFMAFIKSPDGISVELLQKGKRLEPAEPWTSMENIGSW